MESDNPLSDLAEEKMQEINEAYDILMKRAESSSNQSYGYGYSQSSSGSYNYGGASKADFMQVRRDIDMGNLDTAEAALNGMSTRNAEWYFLKGVISSRKGWYDDAVSYLQTACNMDPANQEYQRHYASIANRGGMFRNQAQGRGYNTAANDDLCCQALQCYICADCCCDCI